MACKDIILELASKILNSTQITCFELNPSASGRKYYRCSNSVESILIVYNLDVDENKAYINWTGFLENNGINVPKASFFENPNFYVVQDLGKNTLFDEIIDSFSGKNQLNVEHLLQLSLSQLARLQFLQAEALNIFYPIKYVSERELYWDLNYFKYNFLKIADVGFHEAHLQDDFDNYILRMKEFELKGLQFRDFQSRNIILYVNDVYFIDFQGIRIGDVVYDAVSLLYQSRLKLSDKLIEKLKEYYKSELAKYISFDKQVFEKDWHLQALFRNLQTLGAYGLLGMVRNKHMFQQPLQNAIQRLHSLLQKSDFDDFREIKKISLQLFNNKQIKQYMNTANLQVKIQSFSFKKGVPLDETEHGGGYIFDCRAVNNPGRVEGLKQKNGKDLEVIEFLENEPEMIDFLGDVYAIVSKHVDKYLLNHYEYLSVSFGCTGGQHRSVYSSEKLALYLQKKYASKISISLSHRELSK